MNHNPDEYYNRTEVSNSDLTALRDIIHPRPQFGDREAAFRFGTLVDAIITEPARVDYYRLTVMMCNTPTTSFITPKRCNTLSAWRLGATRSLQRFSNWPTRNASW